MSCIVRHPLWLYFFALPQQPPFAAQPEHPPAQEQETFPFLRFIIAVTTIAINITAMIAEMITVGKFIFLHPLYQSLTYLFFLNIKYRKPIRTATAIPVHTVNSNVVKNVPNW